MVGNPSSVHAEGRAAKALMERARAADRAGRGRAGGRYRCSSLRRDGGPRRWRWPDAGCMARAIEHDAVRAWVAEDLPVSPVGAVAVTEPGASTLQAANSETGILQGPARGAGRQRLDASLRETAHGLRLVGHRYGAYLGPQDRADPKGIGGAGPAPRAGRDRALFVAEGRRWGRRSGTENLIGIAGFGVAAQASLQDVGERHLGPASRNLEIF